MIEHDCMVDGDPDDEERAEILDSLRGCLAEIEAHDDDYGKRYTLVLSALMLAGLGGLEAGIRLDPAEPEWPVAYIELPTGQVSWHMPQHPKPYDGHSTEEKYARARTFINEVEHHQNHEADRG